MIAGFCLGILNGFWLALFMMNVGWLKPFSFMEPPEPPTRLEGEK